MLIKSEFDSNYNTNQFRLHLNRYIKIQRRSSCPGEEFVLRSKSRQLILYYLSLFLKYIAGEKFSLPVKPMPAINKYTRCFYERQY